MVVIEESREKAFYQPNFFSKLIKKNSTTEAKKCFTSPSVLVLKAIPNHSIIKPPEDKRKREEIFHSKVKKI